MPISTYQKSKLISKDDPFYTEFYDEVLQKEFHLTLVKENADIQLTPLFAPRFRVSETLKKSIYILGESIYVQRNKPIQKILALFGTLHIPVRYVPTWFKTLCGLWDMYILCFFGLKQLERLAKQKNALLIGTNRPQARFAKMLSMPFFIPTFHKRMDLFFAKRQAKPKPKFCCTIFSNLGGDALERVKFMQQLSAYKTVDCFGKTSFNNMKHRKDVPKLPQFWWENIAFLSQYKFVICFENSFKEDYVTEKLPNALLSGVIAIYRGAPNVGEYFNTRSFVNFDDFGSYQKMIDEIIAIDQDDEKYNAYLKEPLFPNNQIPRAISDKVEAVKQSIHQLLSSSL